MLRNTGVKPTANKNPRWRFSRQEIRRNQVLLNCYDGPFDGKAIRLTNFSRSTLIFSLKGFHGRYITDNNFNEIHVGRDRGLFWGSPC